MKISVNDQYNIQFEELTEDIVIKKDGDKLYITTNKHGDILLHWQSNYYLVNKEGIKKV